jgi:signal transduction histidine kinase
MPTAVATRLAWAILAGTVTLWLLGTLLWLTSDPRYVFDRNLIVPGGAVLTSVAAAGDGTAFELRASLVFLSCAVVGSVIAARRPWNPIGWLLWVAGASMTIRWLVNGVVAQAAVTTPPPGPLAPELATILWASHWLSLLAAGPIAPVLLLFPNGRLPSRRWLGVLVLVGVGFSIVLVARAITLEALRGWPFMSNPYGVPEFVPYAGVAFRVGATCLTLGYLLAAASLVIRARRALPEERTQLKWLAYGGVLLALTFPAAALGTVRGSELGEWQGVLQTVSLAGTFAFIGCMAIAMLRHRLYDVDLLINKTIVYGALAAMITAAYVGFVVGLGAAIGRLGEANLVLSLAATAFVAVAFEPVRERLQRVADRLVYGERANPYDVLAAFGRRAASALTLEEVLPQMAEVAAMGMGAARSRVRVFLPTGGEHAAVWPPGSDLAEPYARSVDVFHQGERVGEIAVTKPPGDSLSATQERLLADLASQAGPALSNVRLAEELRANLRALAIQTQELRASRQRIVTAQDAARRQLERDIHDGAQQHLVAIAVTLRLARQMAEKDPAQLDALLEQIAAQAADALEILRTLARGLFPSILVDRGLVVALKGSLTRTFPSATLATSLPETDRFDAEVETGVYFCCLEALQNASKHAPGSAVAVRLDRIERWLTFEVQDDGPGFEPTRTNGGSGLLNMSDRMAALGGSLIVTSSPGEGTTVAGRAPLHAR